MVTVDFKEAQPGERGYGGVAAFFTARLQLSTGEVVGTGYAGTQENAIYFACVAAAESERGKDLARFEARCRGFKIGGV